MNVELSNNNYIVVPNFISPFRANALSQEFKQYSTQEHLEGDPQVPESEVCYNYRPFLELLCEKTPQITEIIGEPVLPTYCYSRIYKTGNVLEPHVDRESCEISLTVNLSGDQTWPIFIKTPDGNTKEVNLNPGDAMLYLGCIAPHWREEFKGSELIQVFLHYVKSRGDNFEFYFDRKREETNSLEDRKTIVEVEEETKNNSSRINYCQTLTEFISVFDGVLSHDLCDQIIEEYKDSPDWKKSAIASMQVDSKIRNCYELSITEEDVIAKNFEVRKVLDNSIFEAIHKVLPIYIEQHGNFSIEQDCGYTLLKYEEGQFYTQHTDSFLQRPRTLSCSINLTDDHEGGEFGFFDRQIVIKPKKGSILFFPSNFMFPHEILPVTSGTRYSIITWLA